MRDVDAAKAATLAQVDDAQWLAKKFVEARPHSLSSWASAAVACAGPADRTTVSL